MTVCGGLFGQMVGALFLRSDDAISVLAAYFDDSGTHAASSVVVVAGFVSTVTEWIGFNHEWEQMRIVLRAPPIHMVDLESLEKDFSRKRGWNKGRKERLLQEACAIIRRQTIVPIGHAVIRADWESTFPKQLRQVSGGPVGWCASECVQEIYRWKRLNKIVGGTQFVFERGTKGIGYVEGMFRDRESAKFYAMDGFSLQGKELSALQAADMLAYEVYRQVENQIVEHGQRPLRAPLGLLIGARTPRHVTFWNKERLAKWLARATPYLI
jgi:hypothetical protein